MGWRMDPDERTINLAFYEEHYKQQRRLSMVRQQDVKKTYEHWQELNP